MNSANTVTTVNATAANMLSGADITVTGGTAADTLNISTSGSENIVFASRITNVDTVNIVDGTPGADITLTLGAYATALTINGSVL